MPVRKDLRHFYRGRRWAEVRTRILRRARGQFDQEGSYTGGARCESCFRPDRTEVFAIYGKTPEGEPFMLWRTAGSQWKNSTGWPARQEDLVLLADGSFRKVTVRVVLQLAHLNHTAGDDREENLKLLCGWCHFRYDAASHREVRVGRKDAKRPLLVAIA